MSERGGGSEEGEGKEYLLGISLNFAGSQSRNGYESFKASLSP